MANSNQAQLHVKSLFIDQILYLLYLTICEG